MRENTEKIRLQNLYLLIIVICITAFSGCASQQQASTTNNRQPTPEVKKPTEIKNETTQNKETIQSSKNKDVALIESEDIVANERTTNTQNTTDGINSTNFNKIKEGMTYEEVSKMIGDEGMKVSIVKVNERETLTYKWATPDFKRYIDVTFENNKMIKKANKGL